MKDADSPKPLFGFVNDSRPYKLHADDEFEILWIYRNEDLDEPVLRRVENKYPTLSNKKIFLSDHHGRV